MAQETGVSRWWLLFFFYSLFCTQLPQGGFLYQPPTHQSRVSSSLPLLRWVFFLWPLLEILFSSSVPPALPSLLFPSALVWSSLSFSSSSSDFVSFSQHLPSFLKHVFTEVPETPPNGSVLQAELAATGCVQHKAVHDLLPQRSPHSHTAAKTLPILPNAHLKPPLVIKKKSGQLLVLYFLQSGDFFPSQKPLHFWI